MIEAAFWGLIQGLTEFLPISSSGHLVLVPALLGREGPDLATSAVLHLGTLIAVLAFFRRDVKDMVKLNARGRGLLRLLVIGTIPAAAIGLAAKGPLERLNEDPSAVAIAMVVAGCVMIATRFIGQGRRGIETVTDRDAVVIGAAQALALIPGITRSGMTITGGIVMDLRSGEAARFSFLLGIPAIAGAGLLEGAELMQSTQGIPAKTWVGVAVAAVAGYMAIALLLRLIRRIGLVPFGGYCVGFGVLAFLVV
jgi:undecaprenyl-diphosphatase